MTIGEQIRKYRFDHKMTQMDFAKRVLSKGGIEASKYSVSRWENGNRHPSRRNMLAISKIFVIKLEGEN